MPIYEYSCRKCGQTIEMIQRMSDPPPATHQDCGGRLTKQFSAPSFQVKGSAPQGLEEAWSKDPSVVQSTENRIKRKEKAKKAPRIINTPNQ